MTKLEGACPGEVLPTAMSPVGGSFGASVTGTAAWNWKLLSLVAV